MRSRRLSCFRLAENAGHAMVDFPAIDGTKPSVLAPDAQVAAAPPYLPFRRISLPSAPNLAQRQSIVSTASFDSIPEGPPIVGAVSSNRSPSKGPKRRPSSQDALKRAHRRKEVKSVVVVDEHKEAKRRKVIHELYETERTYVNGLELIYSVRPRHQCKREAELNIEPSPAFLDPNHCFTGHA